MQEEVSKYYSSFRNHRYSFQGQEKDDEVIGASNSINYTYRMHDVRVGRFFAVDPLAGSFPWNSTYAFSENRVLDAIELEGLESVDYLYSEKGISLTIITGIALVEERGTAYDDYGTSRYTMKTELFFDMPTIEEGVGPNLSFGGNLGISGGYAADYSDYSFYGGVQDDGDAISLALKALGGIELAGDDDGPKFSFSLGLQVATELQIGNAESTVISVSVTNSEAFILDKLNPSGLWDSELWSVGNVTPIYDENGTVLGYKGVAQSRVNFTQEHKQSNITVYSKDKQMWASEGYVNNALEDPNFKGTERFFFMEVEKVINKAKESIKQSVPNGGASASGVNR